VRFDGKKHTTINPKILKKKPNIPQALLRPFNCASLAEKKAQNKISNNAAKTNMIVKMMFSFKTTYS